jgi:PAS domain S-box-containing protein
MPTDHDQRAPSPGAAEARRAHYRELLQGLYDAILLCDREGRILESNVRAEKLLRIPAEHLVGRNIFSLILGFEETLMARIERRLATGRFTVIEAYCARGDETTFPAEVAISQIPTTAAGEFLFSIRNIEWRKKTEEAIRREAEAQMARARAAGDFSGYLHILSISDLLQLCEAARKSGILVVTDANGAELASVEVLDGQIVRARCGDRTGEDAVYEMIRHGGAAFYFRQGRPEGRDETITQSTMGLLLEASRRLDEERADS